MFDIVPTDIEQLDENQFVKLLSVLLLLEAYQHNIPANCVHVPQNITVSDGGEDGRLTVEDLENTQMRVVDVNSKTNYFFSGINLFQVKATNMNPEDCYKEVLKKDQKSVKPNVKKVLDVGGTYILFYKYQLVEGNVEETVYGKGAKKAGQEKIIHSGIEGRKAKFVEALVKIDEKYKNARIVIYDATQVANWVSKHLSAVVLVHELLRKPVPYGLKTWRQWSQYDFLQNPYVEMDNELSVKKNALQKYFKNKKAVARINGLASSGKTRLALEAVRNEIVRRIVYINAELGDTTTLAQC